MVRSRFARGRLNRPEFAGKCIQIGPAVAYLTAGDHVFEDEEQLSCSFLARCGSLLAEAIPQTDINVSPYPL